MKLERAREEREGKRGREEGERERFGRVAVVWGEATQLTTTTNYH